MSTIVGQNDTEFVGQNDVNDYNIETVLTLLTLLTLLTHKEIRHAAKNGSQRRDIRKVF